MSEATNFKNNKTGQQIDLVDQNARDQIEELNETLTVLKTYDWADYINEGIEYNSSYSYIRKLGKVVFLQLTLTRSTTIINDMQIATLPAELCPISSQWGVILLSTGASAYGRFQLQSSNGKLTLHVTSDYQSSSNSFIFTSYVTNG